MPNFKQPKLRDREWLDAHRHFPCIVCGAEDGTVVGAHIRFGQEAGWGQKPSDDLVLPLCFRCHSDQEAHPGPEWWAQNAVKAIARRRYEEWKNGA